MMETNKKTLKIERLIELVIWPIVLIIILIITSKYQLNLLNKTELAFTGLVLAIAVLYYYLSSVLLPLTKRHYTKNIGDTIFLMMLLFLAIETNSYIALLIIIPLAGSFLIMGQFSSMIIAGTAILLVGSEIIIENLQNFNIYFNPAALSTIISISLIFYIRFLSQKARFEKQMKQEEQVKLAELHKQLMLLEYQGKEFTTLAAQQIFTPLATIQSFIQTIQSEKEGKLNERQKAFVNETSIYIEKMHRLLKALLFISKIEFSSSPIQQKPMDILDTVKEVIIKFEPAMKQKNIELKLKYPNEEMPSVKADKEYLPEILERIIDNAIRYSQDKSEIYVTMQVFHKADGAHLYLEIRDTGYGIPQEEQKYLFRKFFRGTNIISTDNYGNGLSLFIVKLLADKQNIIIHHKSKVGLGSGTIFQIDFPVSNVLNTQELAKESLKNKSQKMKLTSTTESLLSDTNINQ